MEASFNGHIEVVKALVQNGADATVLSLSNKTACGIAEAKGYTKIFNYLMENANNCM